MARNKPLTIDVANDESSKLIHPTVPILSNQKSTWDGMKVSYYQHPAAFETPEHHFAQHFISIHLNRNPILKQQVLDGRLKCDRFRDGDICLTPATAPVSVRLEDASELICLYLDPAFMRRITGEVSNVDSFELEGKQPVAPSAVAPVGELRTPVGKVAMQTPRALEKSEIAEIIQGTLITNGNYTQETANAALTNQNADLVSFGKLFLANPDLPERFKLNAPLNEPDPRTFYGSGKEGYTDYPFREPVAN